MSLNQTPENTLKQSLLLSLLLAAMMTGCAEDTGNDVNTTQSSSGDYASSAQSSSCASVPEIDRQTDAQQQTRWENQGIGHYRFEYTYEAWSYQEFYHRYRVTVVDDIPVTVYTVERNGTVSGPYEEGGMNLDALFGAEYGWVDYDPSYGFITALTTDIPCAVDARRRYTVNAFAPIDASNISAAEWMRSLFQQMEALVDTRCETTDQCAAAPYGVKPCGGPMDFIVYGTTGTDEAALMALIARYDTYNDAANAETNASSDCSINNPPVFECSNETWRCTVSVIQP